MQTSNHSAAPRRHRGRPPGRERRAASRSSGRPGETGRGRAPTCSRTATTSSPCALLHAAPGQTAWQEAAMRRLGNDRWQARVRGRDHRRPRVHRRGLDRPVRQLAASSCRRRSPPAQDVGSRAARTGRSSWRRAERRGRAGVADPCRGGARTTSGAGGGTARHGPLGVAMWVAIAPTARLRLGGPPPVAARRTHGSIARCAVVVDRERARFGAWYEMFPRSAGQRARPRTGPSPTRRDGSPTSAGWASTSSICRRSIRSAGAFARDRTTRLTPRRTIRAARGRSAPPRAATRRSIRSSARCDDFRPLGGRRPASTASRSRSTSPSSARPTIPYVQRAPRVVPPAARRHDQVRRESAQEVSGHLPARLRERGLARRCGTS